MKQLPETERLIIREFQLTDAEFIIRLVNSEGWIKYIGDRNIHTNEDACNYLVKGPMKSYTDNGFGLWAVVEKKSGLPIGMCGLIRRETLEDVDIGFAMLPEYSGKGYGYESARAILDYGIHQLHLPGVVAITIPDNKASIALLEKLGMKNQGIITIGNDPEELLLFRL